MQTDAPALPTSLDALARYTDARRRLRLAQGARRLAEHDLKVADALLQDTAREVTDLWARFQETIDREIATEALEEWAR